MADPGLLDGARQGLERILLLTAASGATAAVIGKSYDYARHVYKSVYKMMYKSK